MQLCLRTCAAQTQQAVAAAAAREKATAAALNDANTRVQELQVLYALRCIQLCSLISTVLSYSMNTCGSVKACSVMSQKQSCALLEQSVVWPAVSAVYDCTYTSRTVLMRAADGSSISPFTFSLVWCDAPSRAYIPVYAYACTACVLYAQLISGYMC
jgi:hypothetical protein